MEVIDDALKNMQMMQHHFDVNWLCNNRVMVEGMMSDDFG